VGGLRGVTAQGELFRRGDVDLSGEVDISDGVSVFDYLFLGGEEPGCLDAMDSNDDGQHDIADGIFILNFLFLGGPIMPAPSPDAPCAGLDPTSDAIGCESGELSGTALPEVEIFGAFAPPEGVRQRSRDLLDVNGDGHYVVREGEPFVLLLEARRNEISRAPFSLVSQATGVGDPSVLDVRCDLDIGDPRNGGVAAGENLATRFGVDIDRWTDPVYLLDHLALRLPGDDATSPSAGVYRFTARVSDDECSISEEFVVFVRVETSRAPVIRMHVEDRSAKGSVPLQHHEGSGGARFRDGGAHWLVVEIRPNPHGGPAADSSSLRLIADPPFAGGADFTAQLEEAPAAPGIFTMRLEDPWIPATGNTRLEASVDAVSEGLSSTSTLTLEIEADYAIDVQPVWNLRCTGCHEQPNNFQGLELVASDVEGVRRGIVNRFASQPDVDSFSARLVRPYLPESSYLWRKITGTHTAPGVGGEGTRMPQGEAPLTAEQLHTIRSWILQGGQ
jgi:hypothetical protein